MKQMPLYEQIYREILKQIEDGTYRIGDRLPSEKELSDHYHVSRITSKKAVELLADAGLVVRMPGKGTFVSETAGISEGLAEREEESPEKQMPIIGVILDGFGPDFGCRLLGSIEAECQRQGLAMLLRCSYGKVEGRQRRSGRCAGSGQRGF